jgi:hypothetical protein
LRFVMQLLWALDANLEGDSYETNCFICRVSIHNFGKAFSAPWVSHHPLSCHNCTW